MKRQHIFVTVLMLLIIALQVVLGALLHDIGHLVGMNSQTEENWSLKNHGEVIKNRIVLR